MTSLTVLPKARAALCLAAAAALLAACAQKPAPTGFSDPLEANNREIHEFNRSVDRAILRPVANTFRSGTPGARPGPVMQGVTNFAQNLDVPGAVVNTLLQGRPQFALENTLRFALNTTVGIGGLFDPASAIGLHGKTTDFGETLHVWGVGEGNYVELPLLGPSTERDMVGRIVDIGLNPMRYVLPKPESNIVPVAKVVSSVGERSRYSETVDSVLYESADSYAQARLLYLQNRRFQLGQTAGEAADAAFEDPYEDIYGE
ncbi:MlaA family lipoprotein [Pseudotabrizicola algicola]|uniref:VacJ family lipoprotein n=1 Tax=Pseudotabrizicola algicola TaxID=2709381 RepID=A0A6B3RSD4_9RHOB|nr:VacJ family lipoprotein [Pseudotabrizicola algicola]NEX45982.1 VacJ family lipoprotein [Pseudotabrizicola algicola]